MNLVRSLGLVLPFVTLLACSGHVEVIGGGDDGGSGDGNPAQCPQPAQVGPGESCTEEGLTCSSSAPIACPGGGGGGGTFGCTCLQGTWACEGGGRACPVNPTQVCPDPSQVQQSAYCNVDAQLSCNTNLTFPTCDGSDGGIETCVCSSNSWQCPVFGAPLCPGEAGVPCPPPSNVYAGWACSGSGVQCAGNPQQCGSITVYDAFDCENGAWVDIAQTICDADGGGEGGWGPDGGVPDAPFGD